MTVPPPDGSRDRRIEDPTNLWVIHPAGRALLPFAVRHRFPANAVSLAGLALGVGAAACYAQWQSPALVVLGLVLSVGWLIADGLDGMVARATGTASAVGRVLDGLVDHGVFVLLYVALARSIGTTEGWVLAVAAGAAHAVQSSLYEGERTRFHRRVKGVAAPDPVALPRNPFVRLYEFVATSPARFAAPFERKLAAAADPAILGRDYGMRAAAAMKPMALLSANVRVYVIAIACLLADPRLFWWFEIVPLTIVAVLCMARHRAVERSFTHRPFPDGERLAPVLQPREHRHS